MVVRLARLRLHPWSRPVISSIAVLHGDHYGSCRVPQWRIAIVLAIALGAGLIVL